MTQDLNKKLIEKFEKGYYSFRFEYTDKDGDRRFEVGYFNDGMKPEEALRKIALHVSEYEDGKITDFIDNKYFREKVISALTQLELETRQATLEEVKEIVRGKENPYIANSPHYFTFHLCLEAIQDILSDL